MDSDRKSTVSSFYGGRKSSLDALNEYASPITPNYADHPPSDPERARLDDASSFFNPDRGSRGTMDMLGGAGRSNSAGYNRGSFFDVGRVEPLKGGRDEEEAQDDWDVYADFNNTGPRYSNAFGHQEDGYQKLSPQPAILKVDDTASSISPNGNVEMVTVPALGAEWAKSEMRDMTKAGRREKKNESRAQKWKQWNRGERGLYWHWMTRKVLVFILFGVCGLIALVIAFTIPRVPGISSFGSFPLATASGPFNESIPSAFSRAPTNFTFPAYAPIQVDTTGNYLPLTISQFTASVFDLTTGLKVATGSLGKKTFPARGFPVFNMPLNFTYVAINDTDATWVEWYSACKNIALYANSSRPGVGFTLSLSMDISGLPGKHSASAQVTNAGCPIELPQDAD